MQTFLPYPDFYRSAAVLDWRRLGKQRVEASQILLALEIPDAGNGWANHPATLMWKGYEGCLRLYGHVITQEWVRRGYRNNMAFDVSGDLTAPPWLGDPAFHAAHRSNLLRKAPEWYSQFGWSEHPNLEYVWPVRSEAVSRRLQRRREREVQRRAA